jgi:integrase
MRGHVRKRGNTWSAVLFLGYDHMGKRKYKWHGGFKTKKEAEKFLAAKIQELNSGTLIEPSKQTVSEYLDSWLKFKQTQVRPNTFINWESKVRLHIVPHIGHIQLANLRPEHVDKLYSTLKEEGLSTHSIIHCHRILHNALGRAVKWNLIPRNVIDAVDPPKLERKKLEVWTTEQAIQFLRVAQESRYFVFFLLAITTGMRRGEILGLKWDDIDFENEQLIVRRTVSWATGKMKELEPKTERSRRVIALPPQTLEALRQHKVRQMEERLKLGEQYQFGNYVVTKENGVVPHHTWIHEHYEKLCRKAGVPYIRIHDLRHTHASLLLEQGVHPKIVSERLGHSTIGITLDIYTHVLPSLQHKAAREFGDALFGKKISK